MFSWIQSMNPTGKCGQYCSGLQQICKASHSYECFHRRLYEFSSDYPLWKEFRGLDCFLRSARFLNIFRWDFHEEYRLRVNLIRTPYYNYWHYSSCLNQYRLYSSEHAKPNKVSPLDLRWRLWALYHGGVIYLESMLYQALSRLLNDPP